MSGIERRIMLGGITSAFVTPALARETRTALDLNDPKSNLHALLKILGSTNPKEVVVSFGTGRVYACMDGEPPVPLFGTHSISTARSMRRDDGTFVARQHIVGFRTEFGTETIIDRGINPVTGEAVDLPITDYGISDTEYGFDGTFAIRRDGTRVKTNKSAPRPWSIENGIVALNDDSILAEPGPIHPKVDVVTRYASLADIIDPQTNSAASWFNFSAVDPFRPGLKMPVLGFQLWHVAGRKVEGVTDLPEFIARFAAKRFPDLTDLPAF